MNYNTTYKIDYNISQNMNNFIAYDIEINDIPWCRCAITPWYHGIISFNDQSFLGKVEGAALSHSIWGGALSHFGAGDLDFPALWRWRIIFSCPLPLANHIFCPLALAKQIFLSFRADDVDVPAPSALANQIVLPFGAGESCFSALRRWRSKCPCLLALAT